MSRTKTFPLFNGLILIEHQIGADFFSFERMNANKWSNPGFPAAFYEIKRSSAKKEIIMLYEIHY